MVEIPSRQSGFREVAHERLRQASFGLLVAVLFVAPLPVSSVRDWAFGPLAAIVGVAALILGIGIVLGERRDGAPLATLWPAVVAFAALIIWTFVQTGTPVGDLGSNSLVDEALAALGHAGPRRIASNIEGSRTATMLWL